MNLDLLVWSFTKDLSASCSGTSLPVVLCGSVMSRWKGGVAAGKLTVCLWSRLYKHIHSGASMFVYVCMGCGGGELPLPVCVVKYGVW